MEILERVLVVCKNLAIRRAREQEGACVACQYEYIKEDFIVLLGSLLLDESLLLEKRYIESLCTALLNESNPFEHEQTREHLDSLPQ